MGAPSLGVHGPQCDIGRHRLPTVVGGPDVPGGRCAVGESRAERGEGESRTLTEDIGENELIEGGKRMVNQQGDRPETTMVAVDGTDALAYVIIRPAAYSNGVSIEAGANGLNKKTAAYVLRHVADQWDPPA